MPTYLEKEGFSVLGLEQTANSVKLDKYEFPKRDSGDPYKREIQRTLSAKAEKFDLQAKNFSVQPTHLQMLLVIAFLLIASIGILDPSIVTAKVFMVLMEGDPFIAKKMDLQKSRIHKERVSGEHDAFLESLLQTGSYEKLYSYTHLLNGFAISMDSKAAIATLHNATNVRAIHEDIKMKRLTTHTPEYLGIPGGVWPTLGGARSSGEGVVIGLIDTGINPAHPSFVHLLSADTNNATRSKFRGICVLGEQFSSAACNGKIVGGHYFALGATAAGDFNVTRDYASPFDADGHGSHTASTAAGNYGVPVVVNGFNYGYASGMAPGARIAAYKALYTFGGYMSDVVAAVDQAVEDRVDILSLSVGPSTVPPGPAAFLNVLEMQLLFATRAGVVVIQAAGNGGPSSSSILSFSPWITSVAASMTDRKYNGSIILGNGERFLGMGLAPPTPGETFFPIAAAADICRRRTRDALPESCQNATPFIPSLAQGKLIICTYTSDFEFGNASIVKVADRMRAIGAAGFIMTMDPELGNEQLKGTTVTLGVPAVILNNVQASTPVLHPVSTWGSLLFQSLWEYYNSRTFRSRRGRAVAFTATARILDGRQATYSGQGPIVASYSSRGPDVNNALLQTADVMKPTIMAPGSSIWAAWSPSSEGDQNIKGQDFALVSGTSMATPHVAGVAALIKQRHPNWRPSAIVSAMMTTADVVDQSGNPILAQQANQLAPANPFDFGAGFVNASRALDPGLVFKAHFKNYIQFLCAVPGVDEESIRRATGTGCPAERKDWCSDLNTPSITISNLIGTRKVIRMVSNVADDEIYDVIVTEPRGVRVTVWPQVLNITSSSKKHLWMQFEATEVTSAYNFGEMVLRGNKNHVVRVPIAVYVSSLIGS
ncbi:Subtilisin-like protease SBT2.5-like protein [Drosera capensis]